MQLIYYGNKIIRKAAEKIYEFDSKLIQTADAMYATMHNEKGIGLAAPQVAIGKQLVVMEMEDGSRLDLVNPRIISHSKKTITDSEGCLSIPDLVAKVTRYRSIEVKAKNIYGDDIQFSAQNFFSRVLQHEIDHIQGILYIDRITKKELKKIKSYLIKLNPNYQCDLIKKANEIKQIICES